MKLASLNKNLEHKQNPFEVLYYIKSFHQFRRQDLIQIRHFNSIFTIKIPQ